MARHQNRFNPLVAILICALCVVIGYQAAGERSTVQAQPSAIATVDLNRVMNGLDQWDESLQILEAMQAGHNAAEQEQQDAIDADIERLTAMEPGPEAKALDEQVALARVELEALRAFNRQVVDTEAALRLREFYRNVKTALRQLAETEGYDAVYVDDSQGDLHTDTSANISRQVQIHRQILNRRLLFVNSAIDVTDELIERMNNAFNAGG